MLLNITEFSTEPVHNQISRQIWEKILSDDYPSGTKLPPMRTAARTHHISAMTVDRAYKDLENAGVITAVEGNGYCVASLTAEQKQEIARRRLFELNSPLNVIEAFSLQLSSVFDRDKLCRTLEENLENYLKVSSVHIALFDDNLSRYTTLPSNNFPERTVLDANDALFQAICLLNIPTPLTDVKHNGETSDLRKILINRNVHIVYPLKDSKRCIGFVALTEKKSGTPFLQEHLGVLTVLSNQFVTALTTAQLYIESIEKRRMEEELKLARQIQQGLLPENLPDNHKYQLAAATEPSLEVGGDFYDYLPIDEDRFGLIIADACGKGMPAAMLISQIQALLKSEVSRGNEIPEIMKNLNEHIKQCTSSQNFMSLFFGVFTKSSLTFEYINAGHNYPVVVRENGVVDLLATTDPALGIVSEGDYITETVSLECGDCLLFYTDGVTETMNDDNEEYGEKRLQETLVELQRHSAQEILQELIKDLNAFQSYRQLRDDRTVMVMKILEEK